MLQQTQITVAIHVYLFVLSTVELVNELDLPKTPLVLDEEVDYAAYYLPDGCHV